MGMRIVITGAADRVGSAAVRRLSRLGHEVVAVDSSAERVEALGRSFGIDAYAADFERLSDVRRLADILLDRYVRIDVLAHCVNARSGAQRTLTEDGHERTFQLNYLAPFFLTYLLLPTLVGSQARVLSGSSAANRLVGRFDVTDLESSRSYESRDAYAKAKLAQILFTREFNCRFGYFGLASAAFHLDDRASDGALGSAFLPAEDASRDTLVFLAQGKAGLDFPSGALVVNRRPAEANPQAKDARLAHGLWNRSLEMIAELL